MSMMEASPRCFHSFTLMDVASRRARGITKMKRASWGRSVVDLWLGWMGRGGWNGHIVGVRRVKYYYYYYCYSFGSIIKFLYLL